MKVKLYTSMLGLENRIKGKKVFASGVSEKTPSDIEIWVDTEEIEEIVKGGIVILKEVEVKQ